MATPRVNCTIVELAGDQGAGSGRTEFTATELPLWADPFIDQLVARHRLRAALDDSLTFLQSEASHDVAPPRNIGSRPEGRRRRGPRFTLQDTLPIDDDLQADVEGWPW